MSYGLNVLFSLSVGIGAVIGWVRFKKTDPAFFPFLLLLTAGLMSELISLVVMQAGYSNAPFYNLYSLAEAFLVTWQFRRWGLFGRGRILYYSLLGLYAGGWTSEWIVKGSQQFFSYFIIGYSLVIVLMSISMINRLLFSVYDNLLREPVFLICLGFCIYFIYAVLTEIFWQYGLQQSKSFRLGIMTILTYINLFTNLLFAYAMLWIPLKRHYIMQY